MHVLLSFMLRKYTPRQKLIKKLANTNKIKIISIVVITYPIFHLKSSFQIFASSIIANITAHDIEIIIAASLKVYKIKSFLNFKGLIMTK